MQQKYTRFIHDAHNVDINLFFIRKVKITKVMYWFID